FILTPHERKRAIFLLIMISIMALLDMIGVASILPFMAVLTNPSLIETNLILNSMFQTSSIFGVESNQQFLFVLGIFVFVLLVISLVFKALTTYAQVRFAQMREYTIGKRLMEGYLYQPYSWFLNQHSADVGKNVLAEVSIVISKGITPLIELISKGMVTIAIIILLILADPKLSLIVGFSISISYIIIYYIIRNYLSRIGNKRLENNRIRFLSISEAFGATKEVKVAGLEQTYIKLFSDSSKICAKSLASSQMIAQLPRFFLEAIAFGGIMFTVLFMTAKSGGFISSAPIISLYVFAGYRLMPAVQMIYASLTKLTFVGPSLDKLSDELKNLKPINEKNRDGVLSLKQSISLKNVDYSYPNSSRTALKNINLNIPAKSIIGLVGSTGSGKTTTVDIILGLLEAQNGTLEIDGKVITKQNLRSWQRSVGYVPQHIYLSDNTVASNIAFGVESKDINQNLVEKASKIADLHNFVTKELPNQYQTTIGERGVRLSGGQRQRIGIARALYHNPQVIILDEATSALDYQTEKAVMDAVNKLSKNITIILIAHRLNTVKRCDKIFLLEKGELINEGTFEELIDKDKNFRITANYK
ncbi:ABC transporter ATP-binding protein, partial [Candidatus Pelagibacter sp.]|nr:ABC transporter ATP-binding protein [Candidatus Pelagibacter sp.]